MSFREIAGIVVAWLALFLCAPALAEEGCPTGTLPSYVPSECKPPSQYSELPLDDQMPMRFETIQVSMTIIYHQAIGIITTDTPAVFRKFLETEDSKYSADLQIHSSGGNLLASMELGQLIRQAGFSTRVGRSIQLEGITDVYSYDGAYCYSACAYAFLGGVTREFTDREQYGVHRFGAPDNLVTGDEAQVVSALLAQYIESMGVDQALLALATSAAFENDIALVSVSDAKRLKVIYDPSGLTTFRIEDSGGLPIAAFEFQNREEVTQGILMCERGVPFMVLFDLADSVPIQLRTMIDFPAEFDSSGVALRASATYYAQTNDTAAFVAFQIPGLVPSSFSADGLTLTAITNPTLEPLPHRDEDDPISDALLDYMSWLDGVAAYTFSIIAENGERTLPLILRDCR